ncbi:MULTISPECIES: hypothetical protein [unclassified Meiothermus]|uniref:hypothetical protein n=1 Tax=unclassified Meiothermus TaxID=370471 RepID=UPI000D7C30F5|nr:MULTISPECIES: hypothetical protein [unclassified Meiothermus]PZA08378.1 hypothetical protein DNA98_04385 [Meiothermus sp. Pnk-1]RYM36583.1 hypothetical protein EWH23_09415 [Meiothermus sp. PNK-Is4]
MGKQSFDERELILELFPGTSPELLPLGEVLYYRDVEGRVHISEEPFHLVLEPLEDTASLAPVLCEACLCQLSRSAAQFVRHPVGQGGRHFRYLALCADTDACRERARPGRLREILLRAGISSRGESAD